MRVHYEGWLVCRQCGRRRRESDFTTGLKCSQCAQRDAYHKQRVTEMRIERAMTRSDSRSDSRRK